MLEQKKSLVNPKEFTLLIVDDEEDLREVLAYQFARDGFQVLTASNGQEALEIIRKQKIDLVISDVQMPGGNGVELLENLRRQDDGMPVVLFITGFADITVEEAFHRGAEAVFAKPFDRKTLLETVLRALSPREDKWGSRDWRGETALPIEIVAPKFEGAREAQVLNLGRGGIFIAMTGNIPPVGSQVSFKIHFLEGAILLFEGHGVVRWVRQASQDLPSGCGIEFIDLSAQSRSKVVELINFIKTKQFIPKF